MRISDWSSDVCSSDLHAAGRSRGSRDRPKGGPRRMGQRRGREGPSTLREVRGFGIASDAQRYGVMLEKTVPVSFLRTRGIDLPATGIPISYQLTQDRKSTRLNSSH